MKIEGPWALVICALGWSLAGVFIKYVEINSFAMAGLRSLFAFITIAALSKRFPRFYIKTTNENNQTVVDKKRTLYMWLAALAYASTMIMFCISNKLTYAANAVLLQYTNPAWIIILGPFLLGEKNSKLDYFAIIGIIIGMLLFFADNLFGAQSNEFADTVVLGNIIALISGITFGLTTILQRKQQMLQDKNTSNAESSSSESPNSKASSSNTSSDSFMIAQIITCLFGLPFMFLKGNGIPDLHSTLFLILLGVLQMGIPNIMYAIGIKKVRALSASLITMIEPLMNPIWVLIFVHEIPSWTCILGGLIILGCILGRETINIAKD
ncbi:MAG: DMT family transporter [Treponema sp.]|nr:DMT family transporter [Treponema sp.]